MRACLLGNEAVCGRRTCRRRNVRSWHEADILISPLISPAAAVLLRGGSLWVAHLAGRRSSAGSNQADIIGACRMISPLSRLEAFCQRFALEVPILLAPMAGACPPSLS